MTFALRLAGCDESQHPDCDGVIAMAAAQIPGFTTVDIALANGREIIGEPCTVGDVVDDHNAVPLPGSDRSTILRDFIVIDEQNGQQVHEGEHDDYDLFN